MSMHARGSATPACAIAARNAASECFGSKPAHARVDDALEQVVDADAREAAQRVLARRRGEDEAARRRRDRGDDGAERGSATAPVADDAVRVAQNSSTFASAITPSTSMPFRHVPCGPCTARTRAPSRARAAPCYRRAIYSSWPHLLW